MALAILPMVFPAQWMFSAFLVCSVIVWGTTIAARKAFAFGRAVMADVMEQPHIAARAQALRRMRETGRRYRETGVVIAMVLAALLFYAKASEATTIIRCGDWCWWI